MSRRCFILSLLWLTTVSVSASAQLEVSSQKGAFVLVRGGKAATIAVSPSEPIVVRKVVELLANDVQRVTGLLPVLQPKPSSASVVVGTIGSNAFIDKLIARGKIDVSAIRGGWEQYMIKVVDGCLVIVGSDRRGTAYGVLSLSEAIGVSPWYWWADVPVPHRDELYVTADVTSKSPSVRYRGVFINDEDWGLKPWSSTNYERELGDIGPRTYSRVCELLLRLKANMLAPAMHSCTGAFYSHPESKVVADSFGIIITTSHCEPLLLNNAAESEWSQQRDGEWNYKTNRETIYKKWDERLAEAARYENIYTVAMRGVHDEGLRGSLPMKERVPLLEKVIKEQRELIEKHCAPKVAHKVPQIFVPYKETMDIYENGLRVPDDITLVWVDDNYGYMKRVSSPEEQQRSGGAGIYYHLSYLGAPHDYLWLNTTPPVLMYEELRKAYDAGANRYWLLNVGDIKPMELGIQTFMETAWNIDAFDIQSVNRHQATFLASTFQIQPSVMQSILDDYYRLAWSRKPEYMGWEYQWDDKEHTGLKSTEFSFKHYDEAQRRLSDYQRISDEVERISDEIKAKSGNAKEMNERTVAAFFELLQFSVQGACQMNRKFLMAQLNQELTAEGRLAEANWAARQMEIAYDSINALNHRYNQLLGGKWNGMMALATSFTNTCQFYQKPVVCYHPGVAERALSLVPLCGLVPDGCCALDLKCYDSKTADVSLVQGLGYDSQVVQLGNPHDAKAKATVCYRLPSMDTDSVGVVIYTVPFWPLYVGKSNRVCVSIDDCDSQIFENNFKEYDRDWKDQVMRNGAVCRLRFAIDKSKVFHTLKIQGDPGQMVQRVIVDWGGLQPSYLGPQY